jgi:Fur family ferric uptake transcriptional regulator
MTNLQELLRQSGLRVTSPRLAVLTTLQHLPHCTAEAIASAARERLGTLSTQAVYDNLHALVKAGLVRCIEPAGSAALYEIQTGDNHHHLICRACSTLHDIDCVVGAAPCLQPAQHHGFVLDEAEVVFWGLCPGCQANANATPE